MRQCGQAFRRLGRWLLRNGRRRSMNYRVHVLPRTEGISAQDQHFAKLGMARQYHVRNPLPFMELQDVQELTNFFERRVSAYQLGVPGEVGFDHAF